MSTLNDLYNGDIHPFEQLLVADRGLIERSSEAERNFMKTLTPEQRSLYDVFENLRLQIAAIDMEQRFVDSFRLGARMMLDMLGEKSAEA